jgi:hypothetical protein
MSYFCHIFWIFEIEFRIFVFWRWHPWPLGYFIHENIFQYKEKKFHFAIADEEEFATELNSLGLGDSGLEQNVVVFGVDGKKYPMDPEKYDEELSENLVAFLEDIGKGEQKIYILKYIFGILRKSEAICEKPTISEGG